MNSGLPAAARAIALLGGLIVAGLAAIPAPASAQANNCVREATSIKRAEGQLPRLDVAPPDDKQIVCITLETNILFARRLAAHLENCPRSSLVRKADVWKRIESQFTDQFSSRQCKPAIRNYRG